MIFIQSDNNRYCPHHFDAACAMYVAIDLDKKFTLISYDNLGTMSDKFFKTFDNVFVGTVEFMKEVFRRINPELYPRVPINANREHVIRTIREVIEMTEMGHYKFVKPFDIKLFTGVVWSCYG